MSLSGAIDALYAAFATVPKPDAIHSCPCCWDAVQACALVQKPLRTLSADDLSKYASSVFLTAGDDADFRYLLPRILEIGATEAFWWPDTEVLLGKLKLAAWESWPKNQRKAVERVIDAWFDEVLLVPPNKGRSGPSWSEGDALLCGLASAGLDLEPYLYRLLDPANADQLRGLYWLNFDRTTGLVKLRNAFWRGLTDNGVPFNHYPSGAPLITFLERSDVQERVSL